MSDITILLVEDHPGDARVVQEVIAHSYPQVILHTTLDGVDGSMYLRQEGRYKDGGLPHLILLDLNLPRKDGRVLLAEIKADPRLRSIPVIVVSASKSLKDVALVYGHHANAYVCKSASPDLYREDVLSICRFWLHMVELPGRPVSAS